jgi:hypothetical protein
MEVIMDLMTILLAVVLVIGLWFVLSRRINDIETDFMTLGRATGKEDLLISMHNSSGGS